MTTAIDRYNSLKQVLSEYQGLAIDTLLAYIPPSEPRRYLYDLVESYPRRPGKGFRPALCIATCKAFGGTAQHAFRSAAALELFHNACLVHDDVEDESDFRRGGQTLNREFGNSIAVNVGDAMNMLCLRPIMENLTVLGPNLTYQIFSEIEHMVRQSVEGQALELGWVRDVVCEMAEDDYLRMVLKKTCWYTCIHPCRIGSIIGTGGQYNADLFNKFGYYMGAAFQIQDDILNLVGDLEKYGKEIGGDIWEGKRTLMMIHLLNHCTPQEKDRLRVYLCKQRKERTAEEVAWVFELMGVYQSIEYARSSSRQLAGAALREFFVAFGSAPDSADKRFIQDIVLYMIERDL
ncbi:MAG TPA: polyprenyl synthetase family protein [Bacteroidota bacterium]|nr:polyprenyl synthetase family protein [Bacteroidota bacterium]